MRHLFPAICILVLPCLSVFAQTPDLSGTWISKSNNSEKWFLTQKDGKLHFQIMTGDKQEANFTCPLDGQECKAKEDGHVEKINMYFNGAKLVEICERGSETTKRRLTISADGKTLTVETVPLSNQQKSETMLFDRQTN